MFEKDARLMVLDGETPTGMMTLSIKVDENNSIMAGHYLIGDFHSVRWLLEAMSVNSIALDDGSYVWAAGERSACADTFAPSAVTCY